MNRFREIEYKYDASNISLKDFRKVFKNLSSMPELQCDTYFVNNKGDYIRYRELSGEANELTIKIKDSGSIINRLESELYIQNKDIESIKTFLSLLGYSEKKKIHKIVYNFYDLDVSIYYYTVLDEFNNKLGDFIEIESCTGYKNDEKKALESINKCEKELALLDITPQNRLTKSLYDLFIK